MRALSSLTLLGIHAAAFLLAGCEFFPEPPGEKYALVYGISMYDTDEPYDKNGDGDTNDPGDVSDVEGAVYNLTYTDDDAIAIADLLLEKGYQVYLRVNGTTTVPTDISNHVNANVDSSTLISRTVFSSDINNLNGQVQHNDTFLFYFSGHGSYSSSEITGAKSEPSPSDSDEEYLIFNSSDTSIELQDYYSDDAFYIQFKRLASQKNIVIVDACFSGGLIGQVYDVDTTAPQYYDGNENRDGSLGLILNAFFSPTSGDIPPEEAIVITAAGERELSLEELSYYKHGIFTYYLLETEHQDINSDGVITTSEAYGYVRYMIQNEWNARWTYSDNKIDYQYYPRISGGPVDYVLFKAD